MLIKSNRHKSAPKRKHPSSTVRLMIKNMMIHPSQSHLDFGCGYGKDTEWLNELGFKSKCYDPYYFPTPLEPADIVTMTYVLNVIETWEERVETLKKAWELAQKTLIVADHVKSSNKSQKENWSGREVYTYKFSHNELKSFVEIVTQTESEWLTGDKLVIHKSAKPIKVWSQPEIKTLIQSFKKEWIAPKYANIRKYNTQKWTYYRIESKLRNLPGKSGPVSQLHLKDDLKIKWAIKAMIRRNMIMMAKLHCNTMIYCDELNGWKPNLYSGICGSLRESELMKEVLHEVMPYIQESDMPKSA